MKDTKPRYPGRVRVVGAAENGLPLVSQDVRLEVQQRDGTWIPLGGVCSFVLSMKYDRLATVHNLEVEIEAINLDSVLPMVRITKPGGYTRRALWTARLRLAWGEIKTGYRRARFALKRYV